MKYGILAMQLKFTFWFVSDSMPVAAKCDFDRTGASSCGWNIPQSHSKFLDQIHDQHNAGRMMPIMYNLTV